MAIRVFLALAGASVLWGGLLWGYPLDGADRTGIGRLEGQRRVQLGKVRGRELPSGALLPLENIGLKLRDRPGFELPRGDAGFRRQILEGLGEDADRYAFAVLDLSDPERPLYAEHRGGVPHNPASVGKLLVALGILQALADLHPDDPAAREKILRNTAVSADRFILTDSHDAPFWTPGDGWMTYRPLRKGDAANLWTWLDWTLSASSNAAASVCLRELLLMVHFGARYPVSAETAERFWNTTPKRELSALLHKALSEPVERSGLDPKELRQGKFFTWKGKELVPGRRSYATPRMLMKLLVGLEQGKLVDPFSSLELKRLMYMTDRRIRYASSPALSGAALYFKSGSLYACDPEPGYECEKYEGNRVNLLSSVAIVEEERDDLHYLVVLMSDVLRKNASVAHQGFATRLHRLIEERHRERGESR